MDQLKDTISNISIYDVKAYVRKAQNVVMNYTETEARVREATNNEPWGASSTLMKEIAQGTNFSQEFHEIMPMIYKRFTEKSASEWRQIYKALQLLEFLVKNGSERVVDYARSHLGVIEMLKHFHYIDSNGKDQGINIRNRAKELNNLLNDVEKIRSERKKARANLTKYGGVGSDESGGFGGTGKKYGGFGSESLQYGGGYEGQVFGDGGGFNGSNYIGPGYNKHDDDEFEEYQVGGTAASNDISASSSRQSPPSLPKKQTTNHAIADFISFDDEPVAQASNLVAGEGKLAAGDDKLTAEDDDEFDEFQSAVPAVSGTKQAPAATSKPDLNNLFGSDFSTSQPFSSSGVNTFTAQSQVYSPASQASISSNTIGVSKPSEPKKNDAFGDLWSTAAANVKKPTKQQNSGQSASLASMAQENAKKSMWGSNNASSSSSASNSQTQNDDLLSF